MNTELHPRGYPLPLSRPINGKMISWTDYFEPIKAFSSGIDARILNIDKDAAIRQLILSMLDIDRSMRYILIACEKYEEEKQEPTGCWLDASILARPQLETVFLILLSTVNAAMYLKWHEQWSAIQFCVQVDWQANQYKNESSMPPFMKGKLDLANRACESLGITEQERTLAVKKSRGGLSKSEKDMIKIKKFPGPAEIVKDKLLQSGPCQPLADMLYHSYTFLCGPAHASARFAGEKSVLRKSLTDTDSMSDLHRKSMIISRAQEDSIFVSGLSIVCACTALVVTRKTFREDPILCGLMSRAWDFFEESHPVGRAIYQSWAKKAMGIIGD